MIDNRPEHIKNKDNANLFSSEIAQIINVARLRLTNLVLTQLMQSIDRPQEWYKIQQGSMRGFSKKVVNIIQEQKKEASKAIKKASKIIVIPIPYWRNIEKKIDAMTITEYNQTINAMNVITRDISKKPILKKEIEKEQSKHSIYEDVGFSTKDKFREERQKYIDGMVELIKEKVIEANGDGTLGTVTYADGRKVKWEDFIEMQLRTDLAQVVTNYMIEQGFKNKVIFYACACYTDCWPDHQPAQKIGKFYDARYKELVQSEEELNQVEAYLENQKDKIIPIQEVITKTWNFFSLRYNCRHYFIFVPTDTMLKIKTDRQLENFQDKEKLWSKGSYDDNNYKLTTALREANRKYSEWKQRLENQKAIIETLPNNSKLRAKEEAKLYVISKHVLYWGNKIKELEGYNK